MCVMRDPASRQWLVSMCGGNGRRDVIRRFESQDKASEFAVEERYRRMQTTSGPIDILFPVTCPCDGSGMKW
jgi:hypothetical protein